MLLVSPDTVLVRASMTRTVAGVNDVVISAIEGAGALVEAMLSTSLERRFVVDYFTDRLMNRDGQLNLSSQLIAASPSPVLYVSDAQFYSEAVLDGDPVDPSLYGVAGDAAAVLLAAQIARSGNFAVAYESGFNVDSGNVAMGVPTWLRESVISATLYVLQAQVISHQKSIEQRDYTNILRKHLYSVVAPYIRPMGGRNLPAQTVYGDPIPVGP